MNPTVKLVGETDDAWIYEGLAIPYGGPANGQDLTGSHFTKETDLCLEWFPDAGRPLLYRHGFDASLKTSVIGRETGTVREDDRGRWVRLQIDKAKEYAAEVRQLAEEGVLALSSGAVDHLTSIAAKTGEIVRWPWVELSLVPNPANPEALLYQVKSADALDHLTIVGLDEPEAMKSEASDDAQMALYSMESLVALLGDESDETQAAKLRAAIDAVQAFLGTEIAAIGTPPDIAETATEATGWMSTDAIREGKRNSADDMATIQTIHDSTRALGAACGVSSERSAPTEAARLVITGTAAKAGPDLGALTAAMTALATAKAKELLGAA